MKNTFTYIGLTMLLLNSIIGLIASVYSTFNWIVNDAVIALNTLLFLYLAISKIKDGFKFGIGFLLLVLSAIQFVLGLFLESYIEDNLLLVILLSTIFVQLGALIFVSNMSKYS
ncbi:MAG: hypothetical protein P8K10_06155 [Crocinitomicaceae bacterium]|nr:hypothetical protein [Crocinitomicaceae bacterium]